MFPSWNKARFGLAGLLLLWPVAGVAGDAPKVTEVNDAERVALLNGIGILGAYHSSTDVRVIGVRQAGRCGASPQSCPDQALLLAVAAESNWPQRALFRLSSAKRWELVEWRAPSDRAPVFEATAQTPNPRWRQGSDEPWWETRRYAIRVAATGVGIRRIAPPSPQHLAPGGEDMPQANQLNDAALAELLGNLVIQGEHHGPETVRVIGFTPGDGDENECDGSPASCPDQELFVAVSGGGERPGRKLYRFPTAKGWEFIGWKPMPDGSAAFEIQSETPNPGWRQDSDDPWWDIRYYEVSATLARAAIRPLAAPTLALPNPGTRMFEEGCAPTPTGAIQCKYPQGPGPGRGDGQ